jgi:hypothetical protein
VDELVKGLIHEGGGYLLAAVALYLLYRMDQLRVDDLKQIHARESGITSTLLEVVTENTAALTGLADEIAMLRGSPAALRREISTRMKDQVQRVAKATRPSVDDTWSAVATEPAR